jgi:chromosome partitioning protein
VILTVASFKGGVGKTTTAVHLATYLAEKGSTLLIDGDANRTACKWAKRAESNEKEQKSERAKSKFKLPFKVIDEMQTARYAGKFEHVVIDTEARPKQEELDALVEGCDLLVLPVTPSMFAVDALYDVIDALRSIAQDKYRVLLTAVPPVPTKYEQELRKALTGDGIPLFNKGIRRTAAFRESESIGVPVNALRHPGAYEAWMDYRMVGEQLYAVSMTPIREEALV